jgi:hypothetical protein
MYILNNASMIASAVVIQVHRKNFAFSIQRYKSSSYSRALSYLKNGILEVQVRMQILHQISAGEEHASY